MFGEMKVFSGSSHPELAVGIAAHIGMPLGKSRITRFSNENIKVKIEENVREADVFVIQSSCPPVSDNFMEMLILIDALKYASAARITAVLPIREYEDDRFVFMATAGGCCTSGRACSAQPSAVPGRGTRR